MWGVYARWRSILCQSESCPAGDADTFGSHLVSPVEVEGEHARAEGTKPEALEAGSDVEMNAEMELDEGDEEVRQRLVNTIVWPSAVQ